MTGFPYFSRLNNTPLHADTTSSLPVCLMVDMTWYPILALGAELFFSLSVDEAAPRPVSLLLCITVASLVSVGSSGISAYLSPSRFFQAFHSHEAGAQMHPRRTPIQCGTWTSAPTLATPLILESATRA